MAFAFATNTEAKEDIITEWPGAGNQTKQKVRSDLYQKKGDTNMVRSPLYSTMTNIRKLSDGDLISPMPLRQQAILSPVCKRWNGSSCS